MDKRIVYKNDDGTISIVVPADCGLTIEEIAAKIPTKMIFPLLIFIWPCFFIVAIGPSMLLFTATMGK